MTGTTLTVAAIEVRDGKATVILSDGSILAGLRNVETESNMVVGVTTVKITLAMVARQGPTSAMGDTELP